MQKRCRCRYAHRVHKFVWIMGLRDVDGVWISVEMGGMRVDSRVLSLEGADRACPELARVYGVPCGARGLAEALGGDAADGWSAAGAAGFACVQVVPFAFIGGAGARS